MKSGEIGMKINKMQPSNRIEITERHGKSVRSKVCNVPVLVLRGGCEELGEAQGALAGKDIVDLLDKILIPYVNQAQPNAWDSRVVPAAGSFLFPEDTKKNFPG